MINLNGEQVSQAKNLLENSKNILVVIPINPSIDKIAGALSLYLSLSAAGKQVSLVTPTEMTVQFNQLVGVDKISTSFNATSGKNLIISFPYQEGSIEKVSYNIENDTFNLVIEPREGYSSILPEMMRYSFSGGNYDAVVTIGCLTLANLGQLYSNNQNLFNEKPLINIDHNSANANFGKTNLVDATQSSVSELILGLLDQIGLTIEADMATNLLIGITSETDNFSSPKTSASTFEAAASLLKLGAKKTQISSQTSANLPQFSSSEKKPDQITQQKAMPTFGKSQKTPFSRQQSMPQSTQFGFKPKFQSPNPQISQQSPQQRQPQQSFGPSGQQPQHPPIRESGKPPETPPDWLKPKIYKGSTLL